MSSKKAFDRKDRKELPHSSRRTAQPAPTRLCRLIVS